MSIINYLDTLMGEGTHKTTSRGTQYSYNCPICGDHKDRLFVHPSKGVCHCHNCGYSHSIVTLIADITKGTWRDSLTIFRTYAGYNFEMPENIENEIFNKLIKLNEEEIDGFRIIHELPEEFILIEDARGEVGRKAMRYLKQRGVSLKTCEKHYIGYCEEGKYANRIILPDFEDGEIIYWQARTFEPTPTNPILKKNFRKVLNPSLSEEDLAMGYRAVDKSSVISQIDFVKASRTAILCEGRFDALTLGDYGACLHGKILSDDQFIKIVKAKEHLDRIVVMLDGDAYPYALRIAKRLSGYFPEILIAKLDGDADPNSIGLKGCLKAIDKAIPYSPTFEIKARLMGWA